MRLGRQPVSQVRASGPLARARAGSQRVRCRLLQIIRSLRKRETRPDPWQYEGFEAVADFLAVVPIINVQKVGYAFRTESL
jgi:hypothetical protein